MYAACLGGSRFESSFLRQLAGAEFRAGSKVFLDFFFRPQVQLPGLLDVIRCELRTADTSGQYVASTNLPGALLARSHSRPFRDDRSRIGGYLLL